MNKTPITYTCNCGHVFDVRGAYYDWKTMRRYLEPGECPACHADVDVNKLLNIKKEET